MACNECLTFTLPDSFDQECEFLTKDCQVSDIYFSTCDQQFEDLTQESFDAAVTAGKLKKAPPGLWSVTVSSSEPIQVTGCKKIPGKSTYTAVFESYLASEDATEYMYWDTIHKSSSNLNLFYKQCDGIWQINQKWAQWNNNGQTPGEEPTDEPIGQNWSLTVVPNKILDDAKGICKWTMTWELEFSGVLVGTELPGISI
jgi:hypothetical protein